MINLPVRYDKFNEAIEDAKHFIIAHPFRRLGRPDSELHENGQEIADAINAYQAQPKTIADDVLQAVEKVDEPKKRGRKKGG